MLGIVVTGAFLLGNSAWAVDPDRVREETRPVVVQEQVQKHEKADQPQAAAGLSEAFKKYSTTRMLTWRASTSGSIMFMGQFNSEAHCAAARKTLQRQLVRWGWGRAECLEITLP
jgi:hypothetical protein